MLDDGFFEIKTGVFQTERDTLENVPIKVRAVCILIVHVSEGFFILMLNRKVGFWKHPTLVQYVDSSRLCVL
jgi:hypothetical protein